MQYGHSSLTKPYQGREWTAWPERVFSGHENEIGEVGASEVVRTRPHRRVLGSMEWYGLPACASKMVGLGRRSPIVTGYHHPRMEEQGKGSLISFWQHVLDLDE